ncbi:MAG: nucleotidyltransferase [Myxococcaceae bacterium]|nr:nucleotidyltransferase [Myxococcaceae bacterium]MCI0669643.1 nucleotidyltransferase [Myxococcaceae bacterium]
MSANDYLRLLQALTEAEVEFVIVGGTAAVLHGSATATYDLDVLMPFTPSNCERLLRAVSPLHPRFAHTVDKRPMLLTTTELSAFKNLYLLTDLGRLDVLGSLPPVEDTQEVLRNAQWMDVGGLRVRVLALEHLIRVKAAMNRPKDKMVEAELRAIANVKDSAKPS